MKIVWTISICILVGPVFCEWFLETAECAGQDGSSSSSANPPGGQPAANPAAEQPVPAQQPANVPAQQPPVALEGDLEDFRKEVRMKLGIFLSSGGQSVQRKVYDRAWALVNGEAASADELLALDLKMSELTNRADLPQTPKERLSLILNELIQNE